MSVRRFRYRTAALAGPWRPTFGEALEDAIRAGQAARDEGGRPGYRWIVPGEIEAARLPSRDPA